MKKSIFDEILNRTQTKHLPKLDPLKRPKRRRTMIELPASKQLEKLCRGDNEISLKEVTKSLVRRKSLETEKENTPKHKKTHDTISKILTPTSLKKEKSFKRTSKRLSFDGLFARQRSRSLSQFSGSPHRFPKLNSSEAKNFKNLLEKAIKCTKSDE